MNTDGLCECGCGDMTKIANHNDKSKGWIKGRPLRFILGHNTVVNGAAQTAKAIGSRSVSSGGYIRVMTGRGKREYEHILVAEKAIGRRLINYGKGHPMTEVVHHVNGNKTDNSPSNLLVCMHKYHIELHHRLEASDDWPEFPKVTRNVKGIKNGNVHD